MINLVKNEFIKVFSKKGFYIVSIIMLAFILLTNLIYKSIDAIIDSSNEFIVEEYKNYKVDKTNREDLEYYVDLKTSYDLLQLTKKYDKNSWQYNYILEESEVRDFIYRINSYENGLSRDKNDYELAKVEYEELNKKLSNEDWKVIAKEEKQKIEEGIKLAEGAEVIEEMKIRLEGIQMRLDKDISYATGYKNTALNTYVYSKIALLEYKGKDIDKLSNDDKEIYRETRVEYLKAEYSLNNDKDVSNIGTGIFERFFNEYLFMLIIMVFMISGSITSQEFSKGTIKQLLVKPYSRIKILLSKYIVALSSILIAFLVLLVLQTVVGILFFGTESITTSILSYSSVHDKLYVMGTYEYVFKSFLAMLPYFVLLATLSFAASTIFNNTALSVVISFVAYIGSNVLATLLPSLKYSWIKYIYCLNWNLTPYIFGNAPSVKGQTLLFSLIVCFIHLIVLLVPTFIIFKRKDIKNV